MSFDHSAIVRHHLGATASTRNILAALLMATFALGASGAAFAVKPQPLQSPQTVDTQPTRATTAKSASPLPDAHVLVQLSQPAAVEVYAARLPATGGATSTSSLSVAVAASRSQVATNKAQQAAFVSAMQAAGITFKEIYRVQKVMNGVAVVVPASQLNRIRKMAGVKAVRTIVPSVPTSNSSTSFVGANQVWQGIPAATADGTGIRIGIIDTGIDYQHANFGGSGLLADYTSNDRVTITPALFPTAKVVGGTDLAGDNYDANGVSGSATPTPDPNPTDCNGHGSHVAGSAAGFGVDGSGGTFSGPYDTATINALRIQPGIAHNALLYAIRVFGCGGSTDLVVPAIEYAMDPNGDDDLSDHLDVINMSLGSSAGGLTNLDTDASNAASLSGMIVVASAGNSYDTYMITGSPGTALRGLSVAASWDGGESAGQLAVSAPGSIAGNYFAVPAAFGGPIPASPGLSGNLVYALPHNGCTALTNPGAVAGQIAVIDRGTCTFVVKVKAAQDAGAVGVVVVNNSPGLPSTMGGTDATITVPAVMISQSDGQVIEAQLGSTVTANLSSVPGGDLVASFSSRGPVNDLPITLKPDITAPGVNIVSTQTGMTCLTGGGCQTPTATGYDEGNLSLTISGTSMAAPQVTGLVALLRQLHPTATVEEIKALAMNGSIHDLTTAPGGGGFDYGAGRVGAGRIDAVASANLAVAAYNADGSGAVGVTFPGQIDASTTVTKKVRVTNFGSAPKTLSLGIDTIVDNPGVAFSVPGSGSLTLLGHQSLDVTIQMSGSANQVTNNYDPTIYLSQGTTAGTFQRYWVPEETAYLTLDDGGGTYLRVPLYVAPLGAATMSGGSTVPTGGIASGTTSIPLTGTGICTGALTPGPPPSCGGNFPIDVESLVTPFELQVSNPRDTSLPALNDVRYVGVSAGGGVLNFGIALWGAAPTTWLDSDIEVTLVTPGGVPLYTLYPYVAVEPTQGYPTNAYFTGVYKYATGTTSLYFYANGFPSGVVDTRIFQNDVWYLSAPLAPLGLTSSSTIQYYVDSFNAPGPPVEEFGPITYNLGAPGLDFGGGVVFDDLPGATIPVNFNVANLTTNGSLGALLLHHHNAPGTRAQALTVPPVTVVAPVLQSAVSRRAHGLSGTFDLSLSLVAPPAANTNPTTEPRQGPSQMIVFTFDKPINGAAAAVTEGSAVASAPSFSGNDVIVILTSVTDVQYVTVSLTNVTSTDGGTGGIGSARVGFLAGDVNQTRNVSLTDLILVNGQQLQPLTASNFLTDVNVSGSVTVADKIIVNGDLLHALPPP